MNSEQMRNYLLSGADDTPYEDMGKERAKQAWATGEVIRVLQEKAKEYERLLAALGKLSSLENAVTGWLEVGNYEVSIHDLEDYDSTIVCVGNNLVDACEGALSAYDKLIGGVP